MFEAHHFPAEPLIILPIAEAVLSLKWNLVSRFDSVITTTTFEIASGFYCNDEYVKLALEKKKKSRYFYEIN